MIEALIPEHVDVPLSQDPDDIITGPDELPHSKLSLIDQFQDQIASTVPIRCVASSVFDKASTPPPLKRKINSTPGRRTRIFSYGYERLKCP